MKFEIDVPEDEAVEFALALSELAEDFGIPKITETTYATEPAGGIYVDIYLDVDVFEDSAGD